MKLNKKCFDLYTQYKTACELVPLSKKRVKSTTQLTNTELEQLANSIFEEIDNATVCVTLRTEFKPKCFPSEPWDEGHVQIILKIYKFILVRYNKLQEIFDILKIDKTDLDKLLKKFLKDFRIYKEILDTFK